MVGLVPLQLGSSPSPRPGHFEAGARQGFPEEHSVSEEGLGVREGDDTARPSDTFELLLINIRGWIFGN